MCGFTFVGLLQCFAMVRTGLLVPVCGRSWPPPGAWPATAQRQLYNFFTQVRLDPGHLSPAGGAGRYGRCRRLGEPGLPCIPARTDLPWSAAHPAGKITAAVRLGTGHATPGVPEAGVTRQCLGVGVRDEVLVLITPVLPRRRRRLSGHRGGPASGSIASAAPARRGR